MIGAKEIKTRLRKKASPKKAADLRWFFKTGPGEYGEGDKFLGVVVPDIRAAIKDCRDTGLGELKTLLDSKIHEERMAGALCLVEKFKHADKKEQKKICKFYLDNLHGINNWDLVDLSAPTVVGEYLLGAPRAEKNELLKRLSDSKNMWHRRVAMLASAAFIRAHKFADTLALAKKYLKDREDLTHKATGWMLREVGKRDKAALVAFLNKFATIMPRTMLRYSIEKFSPPEREYFMRFPSFYASRRRTRQSP
jgi:3-methyladenine DNA glycosylase AlkD